MDSTLTFKAPDDLVHRLAALAERMERPKSYVIRKAIEQFLEEEEDYIIAMQRLSEDKPSKRISFDQIKQRYGLES
jgi:RHH-type transcriptional regulator, rel operon repressor / antitoxin RelB